MIPCNVVSVSLFVTWLRCAKTAELFMVLYGAISLTSRYSTVKPDVPSWLNHELSTEYSGPHSSHFLVRGAFWQKLYRQKIGDIDRRKRVALNCWNQFSRDRKNMATDQLPKSLSVHTAEMLIFISNGRCSRIGDESAFIVKRIQKVNVVALNCVIFGVTYCLTKAVQRIFNFNEI